MPQQPTLALKAGGVATEIAASANDAVTWAQQQDGIMRQGLRHGAAGAGPLQHCGKLAIAVEATGAQA